jgi:hypothetical protein
MPSAGKIGQSLAAMATVALLAAALALAGCGSSGETTQGAAAPKPPVGSSVTSCHDELLSGPARAAGASCAEARSIVTRWVHAPSCMSSSGQSRGSCTVGGYGCLSTRTDRGIAVSCAHPGRAISFEVASGER